MREMWQALLAPRQPQLDLYGLGIFVGGDRHRRLRHRVRNPPAAAKFVAPFLGKISLDEERRGLRETNRQQLVDLGSRNNRVKLRRGLNNDAMLLRCKLI